MKTDPRFMTAPNKFCRQAAIGETLHVNAAGFQPTSLIHVDDVCRGLIFMAKWPVPGFSAVNLIGETASPAQIAAMVRRAAADRGLDVKVEATPPESLAGDCSFKSALTAAGFSPEKSLSKDLPTVLDYFISRENIAPRPPLQREERETTLPLSSAEERPEGLCPERPL